MIDIQSPFGIFAKLSVLGQNPGQKINSLIGIMPF